MKVCKKCKIEKKVDDFYKSKTNKDGLYSLCKKCHYKRGKEYVNKNRDAINEKSRKWKSKNKESVKLSYKKWYDKNKNSEDGYYNINKDVIKKRRKLASSKYIKKNRQKLTFKEATRRASKKNATPNWYEKDKIKLLYEKCKELGNITGLNYHVDHIIPLTHPDVCGLHVWANLQILEASENASKNNKFIGE